MVAGLHGDLPGHVFKLAPWWDRGELDLAVRARNCAAVTAACLLTRRRLFLESGGFDEARFAVAFNDVDYCFRLGAMGLRCVYAPRAELLHYEGATRGFREDMAEVGAFRERWGFYRDPYHNSNVAKGEEAIVFGTGFARLALQVDWTVNLAGPQGWRDANPSR
jgi:GT2 family glycosyltransferase